MSMCHHSSTHLDILVLICQVIMYDSDTYSGDVAYLVSLICVKDRIIFLALGLLAYHITICKLELLRVF